MAKVMIYDKSTNIEDALKYLGTNLDLICTSLKSTEDIKGGYTLDAIFKVTKDGLHWQIKEECYLKVLCDYGYELFYITKVVRNTSDIEVTARQITIDICKGLWLENVRPTNLSGQNALNYILSGSSGHKEGLELITSETYNSTAYYQYTNLEDALLNNDNAFITRWGNDNNLEVQRRGMTITLNSFIGENRRVEIKEAKNLTMYECDSNADELYTIVRGVGFNGIRGEWVVSDNLDNHLIQKRTEIDYKVAKVGDTDQEDYIYCNTETEVKNMLTILAKREFTVNKIDEVQKSYRVLFSNIAKSDEYKYSIPQDIIYVGDIVRLIVKTQDVDTYIKITKREYDHLRQKITSMTLSNYNYIEGR